MTLGSSTPCAIPRNAVCFGGKAGLIRRDHSGSRVPVGVPVAVDLPLENLSLDIEGLRFYIGRVTRTFRLHEWKGAKEVRQMALVRWDPVRELDSLQGDMNRLFDRFFEDRAPNGSTGRRLIPAMDVVETEDHLVLRGDLPGMTEDDVDIEIKDNVLTVSGERKAEHEDKGEGYHRLERAFGSFSRSLTLPHGIEPDKVEAGFEHGVLEVRIPKPSEAKPTRVQIGKGTVEGSGEEK